MSKQLTRKLRGFVDTINECGIRFAPGVDADEIMAVLTSGLWIQDPTIEGVLASLSGECDEPVSSASGYLTDDMWYFDTECVDGHGAYTAIAQRLAEISDGALRIENVKDFVDLNAEQAWLAFDLDGMSFKWDVDVHGPWVDTSVFKRFGRLIDAVGEGKRLVTADIGGQDCFLAVMDHEQRVKIKKTMQIHFQWVWHDGRG